MSELLANLALGFSVAAHPYNIGFCLLGALVGTLVGVLPGIGTVATVAMLLPITFGLPPVGALIMLAGIYYGAQYGGSTTSVLVNIPGEATSVVTCLDGHQMARQGRAGAALSIAAIGSFFAGCVSTVLVAALGAPLTSLALLFGPAEYFSLMVLGLIFAVVLAKGSVLKPIAMILTGLLLSMVGSDLETGAGRMTFDIAELSDGIGFTNVAMGVVRLRRDHPQSGNVAGEPRHRESQDQGPDADAAGPDRFFRRDRARYHSRFDPGHPARRRRGGGLVRRLYVREAHLEDTRNASAAAPSRVWQRRKRQQRRGADIIHSAAHSRHSAERGDGADGRRNDHPRHRAGSAGHDQTARAVLGHDRLDVARQPDAGHHQPAAGRRVGDPAARALPLACIRRSSCSAASASIRSTTRRPTW